MSETRAQWPGVGARWASVFVRERCCHCGGRRPRVATEPLECGCSGFEWETEDSTLTQGTKVSHMRNQVVKILSFFFPLPLPVIFIFFSAASSSFSSPSPSLPLLSAQLPQSSLTPLRGKTVADRPQPCCFHVPTWGEAALPVSGCLSPESSRRSRQACPWSCPALR